MLLSMTAVVRAVEEKNEIRSKYAEKDLNL